MPRMQPPIGWITSAQTRARLHISDALLSRYVSEGKIRHHVPHGRTHGFYNEEDVRILEEARTVFPGMKRHQVHRSFFAIANRSDIMSITRIDHDAIHPEDNEFNDAVFQRWQNRNPETLFSLRDTNGSIVGFLCFLPVARRSTIDRVIRGEISLTDIRDEDIPLFVSGATIHLYVVAVAIDPKFPLSVKREYGAALLTGFFSFLLGLADRGVFVETLTARSHTRDGISLMRRLGLPWLVSPVAGMELFSVRVPESGLPFLRKYYSRLTENHPAFLNPAIANVTQAKEPLSVPPARSRVDVEQCSMIDTSGLVVGPLFAKEHFHPDPALSLEDQKRWNDKIGMMVKRQVESGKITAVRGEFPHGRAKASYAFDAKGRAVFYQINHNRPGWKNCPDCPHGQV